MAFTCQDGKTVQVKLVKAEADRDASRLDFDEDGIVGFGDFLQFAVGFGFSENELDFDTKFDLDQDGTVGFSDFITFAEGFGKLVVAESA